MIVEGTIMLAGNRSPVFIRETLKSFSAQHEDELRGRSGSYSDELRSTEKGSAKSQANLDDDF